MAEGVTNGSTLFQIIGFGEWTRSPTGRQTPQKRKRSKSEKRAKDSVRISTNPLFREYDRKNQAWGNTPSCPERGAKTILIDEVTSIEIRHSKEARRLIVDVFQAVRRKADNLPALLDELPNINVCEEDGQCLLHTAIAYEHIEAAKDLVRRGIDVNAQDKNGHSPLHFAGTYCNAELARLILANGGDLSISDRHGNTALWSAVFSAKGHYDTVREFIKTDCTVLAEQKNKHGRSPLDFAMQTKDEVLVALLLGQK